MDRIDERQRVAESLLSLAELYEERGALLRQLSDEVLAGRCTPERALKMLPSSAED